MYPASIRSRVKHLSFLMLTLGTLSACSEAPQQGGQAMPPAQVSVQQVTTQSVPFDIELPATLAGDKEVEIRSRVSGIIESRNFEEGQFVKAGHSLFTIELKPFELAVDKAQAALQAAKATLTKLSEKVRDLSV